MAKSMALVSALSLFLSMHMGDVQATHCPSSGCPADDTDDVELIQKRVAVEAPLEKEEANKGGEASDTAVMSTTTTTIREPEPTTTTTTTTGEICYAEALAAVARKHWKSIAHARSDGMHRASGQHALLTGLIRNGAKTLNTSHSMLSRLGRIFADYRILILENDSTDNTVGVLAALAAVDSKLQYRNFTLGMPFTKELSRDRMQRMAKVRNMMHAWVLEYMEKEQWDLIVSLDIDLGEFGPLAIEMDMVFSALGRRESVRQEWDVLCANSLRHKGEDLGAPIGHHDCFAFRTEGHDGFNSPACWETIAATLFEQYELMPVHSCFGGLALYRAGTAFSQCKYDESLYDCEHVGFHKCMRKTSRAERIFLDPMMTTYYSKDINTQCRNAAGSLRRGSVRRVQHKEELFKGDHLPNELELASMRDAFSKHGDIPSGILWGANEGLDGMRKVQQKEGQVKGGSHTKSSIGGSSKTKSNVRTEYNPEDFGLSSMNDMFR